MGVGVKSVGPEDHGRVGMNDGSSEASSIDVGCVQRSAVCEGYTFDPVHGQDRLVTDLRDHTWDRDNVVVGERATNGFDVPGFEREIDLLEEQGGELVNQPTGVVLLGPPGQQKHT